MQNIVSDRDPHGEFSESGTLDAIDSKVITHVLGLVDLSASGTVHIDIECRPDRRLADALDKYGIRYVGFSSSDATIGNLRAQGVEAHTIDLRDPTVTLETILDAICGRVLSSVSMLDVLRTIPNPGDVLTVVRRLVEDDRPVPLVVSDRAAADSSDTEPSRNLARMCSSRSLEQFGWTLADSDDVVTGRVEPIGTSDSLTSSRETVVGAFLHDIGFGGRPLQVKHFVRRFQPTTVPQAGLDLHGSIVDTGIALTVLLRTQGRRPATLRDALLCLLAQTTQDFEVVVLVHNANPGESATVESAVAELPDSFVERTRIVPVSGGGRAAPLNRGLELARGRYISVLDDDDTVFAHWVQTFLDLEQRHPDRMLRAMTVSQKISTEQWHGTSSGFRTTGQILREYPEDFDFVDHLVSNRTPFMSWAFPRNLFSEMGIRFDEELAVCEDWDVVLRGSLICGVATTDSVTAIYRRWNDGDASHIVHSAAEWRDSIDRLITSIDSSPTLLPPGQLEQIRNLRMRADHLEQELNRTGLMSLPSIRALRIRADRYTWTRKAKHLARMAVHGDWQQFADRADTHRWAAPRFLASKRQVARTIDTEKDN